jgi:hypothetical protein
MRDLAKTIFQGSRPSKISVKSSGYAATGTGNRPKLENLQTPN